MDGACVFFSTASAIDFGWGPAYSKTPSSGSMMRKKAK